MKAHQHNSYCGDEFCFHGAFKLKADAVKKEKVTPGAFIKRMNYPPYSISDQRFAVLTKRVDRSRPRLRSSNPVPGSVRMDRHSLRRFNQAREWMQDNSWNYYSAQTLAQEASSKYDVPVADLLPAAKKLKLRKAKGNAFFSKPEKRLLRMKAKRKIKSWFGFGERKRKRKTQPRAAAVHSGSSSSSGVRRDVIKAIAPLYKISERKAAQMVPAAQGGDTFDSLFRRVMAKARRNPELTASEKRALEFYRNFHGHDPDKVIKREATIIESGDFAKIGEFLGYDLVAFNCASMHRLTRTWPFKDRVTGYRAPNVLTEGSGIKLCGANIEEVKPGELVCHQLLIIGGRQDLEWALAPEFGIESTTQFVDLGPIKNIWYFATKKQDNHEGRWYHHTFGEEEKSAEDRNAAMPYLMYDRKGKKQFIVGGNYSIPMEGIRN